MLPPSALAAWPVRPQPWAGFWAAAAEEARSTIVFLTLCAPTLRLFPFLPHHRHSPTPSTTGCARPTRPTPRRLLAARSSGGLGAVANATGFEAPPTLGSRTRGAVLQVGSPPLLLRALLP